MNHRIAAALALATLLALAMAPFRALAKPGLPLASDASPQADIGTDPLELNLDPADMDIADLTLDPALASDEPSMFMSNQILAGIFRVDDETGDPIPELASSWTMSPSAKSFSFVVRGDARWTDGSSVTAYQIRNGIMHALELGTASPAPYAYLLYIIQNAWEYSNGDITDPNRVGVYATDSTHINFSLNSAAAYFPSILALPIARPIPGPTANWTDPSQMITNGPYKVSAWSGGTSMTLLRNTGYYGASDVRIGQVDFSMQDEATAWGSYQSGTLDSAMVPQSEWASALADPSLAPQLHTSTVRCTYYYGFNTAKPPFDNPLVRKAFVAAVDRQGMIDSVLGYAQLPALTYTAPGIFGHVDGEAEGIGIPLNVSQAQAWLASAGYPGGAGLPPITLMFNNSTGHQAIADYIRQNWIDNLGVTVSLSSLPWADYLTLLDTDPPQVFRLGWCYDYADAYDFLHDDIVVNEFRFGSWSNPTYEDALSNAAVTKDLPTRFSFYRQAEEILVETDAVMLPLYYYAGGIATKPHLWRGYGSGGNGGWIAEGYFLHSVSLPLVLRNAP